ncbi:PREDICTED: cadherin-22 [Mandrillus leucophaeus]|uniref:cadherin-22 n=1 Tax=Mandrillus leucophaeus TaxID=9568 RepID=UPI0005F40814|nr:PREDICTED: cadherin-22 [Mandrillus leucophaeus]
MSSRLAFEAFVRAQPRGAPISVISMGKRRPELAGPLWAAAARDMCWTRAFKAWSRHTKAREEGGTKGFFTRQLKSCRLARACYAGERSRRPCPQAPSHGTRPALHANCVLYRYAIDRESDLDQIFDIDADTGAIVTGKGLDRETAGWHNITVLAMEADNHAQLSRASLRIRILDVNDNPPELATPYEAAVCEDAKPGQLIQTISVVDRDEPQGGHRFYFRLVPEAPSNPHFSLLDIQDNTAAVHTQHVGFNRQEQDVFFLPILVVDSGPPTLSSTGTLTIRICGCDSSGTIQSCNTTAFVMAASLSPGALIALLVCVLILVVLVLLILTLRRHHKSHLSSDEDEDMRDNVIKYNDEGGGEQDTEAYDMSALRSLYDFGELKGGDGGPSERHSLPQGPPSPEPDFSVFRDFISRKVALADGDLSVPPYDAFQTYAFEGADSPAGSLSSLHSGSSGSEQDFAYLSSWGPRFRPLAALYAGHRGDDEAQAS